MENKKELIQKAEELGFKYEKEYRVCAQYMTLEDIKKIGSI
jgi:hypothetical protein